MKYFAFIMLLCIGLAGCEKKEQLPKKDQIALAKVGGKTITVGDFQRDYETGYGFLKTGENPKLTYLNHMINERLLAAEAKKLGFLELPAIKRAQHNLRNELMIENLLEREIKSKINVTPEEIREEIDKSKVSFKFRFWTEADYARAKRVSDDMKKRGYAAVLDDILQNDREKRINPKKYETDYLTHLEISEDLLAAIKDLPIGEISDPVEIDGKYFVIQMLDILRSAVTTTEYNSKATSFEQTIFYRKFQKRLHAYAADLLESREIVTKRRAYNRLADALAFWGDLPDSSRLPFTQMVEEADAGQPMLFALREQLDKPFIVYKQGEISTAEFLRHFSVNRFFGRVKKNKDFDNTLHHLVAQTIRDYFMVAQAQALDLEESEKLTREMDIWTDKWLFNESYKHFTEEIKIDSAKFSEFLRDNGGFYRDAAEARTEFLRREQLAKLKTVSGELREKADVQIDTAILDTLKVIEFKKSRWASMQVFKSGVNHPALPNVDPVWDERYSEQRAKPEK